MLIQGLEFIKILLFHLDAFYCSVTVNQEELVFDILIASEGILHFGQSVLYDARIHCFLLVVVLLFVLLLLSIVLLLGLRKEKIVMCLVVCLGVLYLYLTKHEFK